jgi:YVTN family beta-propeller protein
VIAIVLGLAAVPRHLTSRPATSPDFVHFESSHVHPADLTPSGNRLLVVNTPDNRLSVFDVTDSVPVRVAELSVGLEPVSVRALDDTTAWVVNALSNDISVVNLFTLNVQATLRVGDQPADVVFAGTPARAYVSVSDEDAIKVYDPTSLGTAPEVIATPGSMPRNLARSADGSHVYAGLFQAGNHTTILGADGIAADSMPKDPDMPPDSLLPPAPHTGLIVQSVLGSWYDMYGDLWSSHIPYQVDQNDVVEIDTGSQSVSRTFGPIVSSVFGLAVNATDGRVLYVGLNARNQLRFEPRITGYTVETNLGIVPFASGFASLRKLNPHINFDVTPGTQAEADSALGTPTAVAYSANGLRAYVTALADDKIGVLNPYGGGVSTVLARVRCVAGPTGLVVDDAHTRLFVVGRYHEQLQTLSTADFHQIALQQIGFDPTPDAIVNGRKFFYGGFTSSHGDQSCASCHLFGDTDRMGWDLGDPNGVFVDPPPGNPQGLLGFHPMKGPMVTQSLRGIANTEPFHWRGDRVGLSAFNPAFVSLMGRPTQLADSEMTALSDFVLALAYRPNSRENLDRTLPDAPPDQGSAVRGQAFFTSTAVDSGLVCADCHTVAGFAPGTNRQMVRAAHLGQSQDLKVPQLRGLFLKTGFQNAPGAQNKRGFGFTHDGSYDDLATFDHGPGFVYGPDSATAAANRRDLAAYLMAFDSGMAPAVGFQITFDGADNADPTTLARLDTLRAQAEATHCDLVAHGRFGGMPRGWLYQGGNLWKTDIAVEPPISTESLVALGGPGHEITVTGVPPGSGVRTGIDRDRDGYLDGDEVRAGSDPGDPASIPGIAGVPRSGPLLVEGLGLIGPNPFRASTGVSFGLARRGSVDLVVYDVLGRRVRTLARGLTLGAGPQSIRWDGRDDSGRSIGSGVYFVRLKTGSGQWTKPVIRIR